MIKYEVEVDSDGSRYWYLNGQYHREDGPALELYDGSRYWYLNGKRHRDDGPALELDDGTKYWYLNGKLHREDGPAIEESSGSRYWFLNGQRHREDGPAIEWCEGSKFWFLNGQKHREDGPAMELYGGTKYWYLNGMVLPEAEHKLRTMANHQQQTDLVEYIDGLSKGAELAKEEMKQKIEEKLQLWEGEGFVDKAVAASVIYNLITEKGV